MQGLPISQMKDVGPSMSLIVSTSLTSIPPSLIFLLFQTHRAYSCPRIFMLADLTELSPFSYLCDLIPLCISGSSSNVPLPESPSLSTLLKIVPLALASVPQLVELHPMH